MKLRTWLAAFFVSLFSFYLEAVEPQKWDLLRFEDFIRGRLQSVRLSSEGWLSLSLKAEIGAGPEEEFYLSAVSSPDGTIYLGTGHNGRIYRIRNGRSELYFEAQEMDVTSLALDPKGVLYAGTSPNGKIYRITGPAQGSSFFDPEEKYIWNLQVTEKGSLLAAVGERAGLYEISPLGEGKLIYKAQDTHLLCFYRLPTGEIYAGSGGSGRLYLIRPQGKVNLIFDSGFEEIKDVLVDESGIIFIAAAGIPAKIKREEPASPAKKVLSSTEVSITVLASGETRPSTAGPSAEGREPGAVFRVTPDGLAKKLWSSSEEMAYSLVLNRDDRKIYFGTGPKGRIYCLERDERLSLIFEARSEQIYSLKNMASKVLFLGNNPCTLGFLSREQALEGEYLSPVLESAAVSTWGKLEWLAELPPGTNLIFQSRSGNTLPPDETWSDWSPPYQRSGESILSPRGRYLQLRVLFRSQAGNRSPLLQRISLFYLPANLPPTIGRIEILEPNEVFLKPPEQDEVIWGLIKTRRSEKKDREESRFTSLAARKVERQGYQTFRWEASDENGDELVYSIYLRKEGEKEWRLLTENWNENILTLETETLPEGRYELKVVASDWLSNPFSLALTAEKMSLPFAIDHSPPQIKNVVAAEKAGQLELTFEAEDTFSAIKKAEILINPGRWQMVFPVDGLCDSNKEKFELKINLKTENERMVAIRVEDRSGNRNVIWQKF